MARLDRPDSLAPSFLVAMPQLRDSNFARSVVLLAVHGEDGAMGFVVNRRLPATVREVLEDLELPWSGAAEEPVWGGGPVQPQSGWVLFDPSGTPPWDEAREILPGLSMTASLDALRGMSKRPPRRFRLLLGFSGWGPGQLETELREGAWLLVPATADAIFDRSPDEAWEAAYRDLGLDPYQVVPGHGVQ